AVTARAQSPEPFAGFLAEITRSASQTLSEGGAQVALGNAALRVLPQAEGAVRLTAITFGVADLAATMRLLEAASIECEARKDAICVPAAQGQGADFIFKEMP